MLSKTSSTFPTLTTARLTLRQPLESDAHEIFLLRSDATVNKYLDRQPAKTPEEAASFIEKVNKNFKNKTGLYWAITQNGKEKLIGTISLFDFSDQLKQCEIGFELLPNHQGQGFMNEALKQVIDFTFQTLGLNILVAFAHKDNQSSIKLLRKSNFKETTITDEANADLIAFRLSNQD